VAVALYLTLSRAAIGIAIAALLVFVVLGRSRGLVSAAAAIAPITALAVLDAIGVDALTAERLDVAGGVVDARHDFAQRLALLCVAAGALRAVGLFLDDRLARAAVPRPRAAVRWGVAVAVGAALIGGLLVAGAPSRVERQWERFTQDKPVTAHGADRLSEATANGRLALWDVALDAFREEPLHGTGAGTFAKEWSRERSAEFEAKDAHSLFLEALSDLGAVGLALVVVALGTGLVALALRRRADRLPWSAALAIVLCWAAQAGLDWLWEMPATAIGAFALIGLATARATERPAGRVLALRPARVLAGLAVLLLALTPVRAGLSQVRLDTALAAFRGGDCARATDSALASLSALGSSSEPFELLGYCDVRAGRERLGVRMLEAALRRDPGSWELRYGLALTQAAAGIDPRPELRRARRANPDERLIADALERMRGRSPARWAREARRSTLVVPPGKATP
ncbi:MAG: O-antigen ligase family protein, partial [Gemmatimonadaceae bacterium]